MGSQPLLSFLIFTLLYLQPTGCKANTITRIELEDTADYSSAQSVGGCAGGCCTECAMKPINSYRASRNCDAVDPFTCLCADKPLSAALRTAISVQCVNACGVESVKFGTMVLDGYCTSNEGLMLQTGGPASWMATSTGVGSYPSGIITSTTLSGSEASITGLAPTLTPNGGAQGNASEPSLSFVDKVTIGTTLGVGIPALIIAGFGCWYQRRASRNRDVAPGEG